MYLHFYITAHFCTDWVPNMWKCQYTPHSTWPLWWLGYSALEHWTRPVWTPVSLLWGLPGGQLRPLPSHQYQPHILPHPPPSPLFSRWHTPCPPPMCPWIHVFCIQKKLEWRCQTDCQLINLFRHWDFERTIWAEKSFSLAFHRIAVTWLSVLRVFYYNHYRCCRKKGWPMPPPLQQSNKIHRCNASQMQTLPKPHWWQQTNRRTAPQWEKNYIKHQQEENIALHGALDAIL